MATPAVELRGYTPTPYKQDADETVTCPGCDRMNDTDASYCDQCDHPLSPTTAYARQADEDVLCPECRKYNDLDAHYCDQCGIRLEGRPDVTVEVNDDEGGDEVTDDPTDTSAEGVGSAFTSKDVPRSYLVRDLRATHELRAAANPNHIGELTGIFARYSQPYEISSFWEGDFIEIIAPGAFTETIANDLEAMRCLYDHGFDPSLGNKPLGPILSLIDTNDGPEYRVGLINTDYNRNFIVPALQSNEDGTLLGASMRFEVEEDQWENNPLPTSWNPRGLPVRTVLRAKVFEFGPVTFPANPGATAQITSRSDDWLKKVRQDEAFFASFSDRVGFRVAQRVRAAVPAELVTKGEEEAVAAAWEARRLQAKALLALSTVKAS